MDRHTTNYNGSIAMNMNIGRAPLDIWCWSRHSNGSSHVLVLHYLSQSWEYADISIDVSHLHLHMGIFLSCTLHRCWLSLRQVGPIQSMEIRITTCHHHQRQTNYSYGYSSAQVPTIMVDVLQSCRLKSSPNNIFKNCLKGSVPMVVSATSTLQKILSQPNGRRRINKVGSGFNRSPN